MNSPEVLSHARRPEFQRDCYSNCSLGRDIFRITQEAGLYALRPGSSEVTVEFPTGEQKSFMVEVTRSGGPDDPSLVPAPEVADARKYAPAQVGDENPLDLFATPDFELRSGFEVSPVSVSVAGEQLTREAPYGQGNYCTGHCRTWSGQGKRAKYLTSARRFGYDGDFMPGQTATAKLEVFSPRFGLYEANLQQTVRAPALESYGHDEKLKSAGDTLSVTEGAILDLPNPASAPFPYDAELSLPSGILESGNEVTPLLPGRNFSVYSDEGNGEGEAILREFYVDGSTDAGEPVLLLETEDSIRLSGLAFSTPGTDNDLGVANVVDSARVELWESGNGTRRYALTGLPRAGEYTLALAALEAGSSQSLEVDDVTSGTFACNRCSGDYVTPTEGPQESVFRIPKPVSERDSSPVTAQANQTVLRPDLSRAYRKDPYEAPRAWRFLNEQDGTGPWTTSMRGPNGVLLDSVSTDSVEVTDAASCSAPSVSVVTPDGPLRSDRVAHEGDLTIPDGTTREARVAREILTFPRLATGPGAPPGQDPVMVSRTLEQQVAPSSLANLIERPEQADPRQNRGRRFLLRVKADGRAYVKRDLASSAEEQEYFFHTQDGVHFFLADEDGNADPLTVDALRQSGILNQNDELPVEVLSSCGSGLEKSLDLGIEQDPAPSISVDSDQPWPELRSEGVDRLPVEVQDDGGNVILLAAALEIDNEMIVLGESPINMYGCIDSGNIGVSSSLYPGNSGFLSSVVTNTEGVPGGTYDLFVLALDAAGQYDMLNRSVEIGAPVYPGLPRAVPGGKRVQFGECMFQ